MKHCALLLSLIIFFSACSEKNSDKKGVTKSFTSSLQSQHKDGYLYLIDFLKNQKYDFSEVDENIIVFTINDTRYIALKQYNTPKLSISVITFVEGIPRRELLEICNSLNDEKMVTKFSISNDSRLMECTYEFVPNESTSTSDFLNILSHLKQCSAEFLERAQK